MVMDVDEFAMNLRGRASYYLKCAQTSQTPATILGKLVFWFVFIITIVMATDALGISQVSAVLSQLIAFIPNVIAAVLILVLAALLAQFVAGLVRGATGVDVLGTAAQAAIIVYAVFAALTQVGIAVELTAPTFLIVLGGVALAAAIAFGWGARNVAQDIVERAYNRSGEARERVEQRGDGAADTDASPVPPAGSTSGAAGTPDDRRLDR